MTPDAVREMLVRDREKKVVIIVGSGADPMLSLKGYEQVDFYDQERLNQLRLPPEVGKKTAYVMFVGNGINAGIFQRIKRTAEQRDIQTDMYGARILGSAISFMRGVFPEWDPNGVGSEDVAGDTSVPQSGGDAGQDSAGTVPLNHQGSKVERGALKRFVLEHADFNAPNVTAHVRELHKKAVEAGIDTSESSIASAFYAYRSERPPKPVAQVERFPAGPESASQIARVIGGIESDFRAVKVMVESLAGEVTRLTERNKELEGENQRLRDKIQKLRTFCDTEE